jgi:hypothetical protein
MLPARHAHDQPRRRAGRDEGHRTAPGGAVKTLTATTTATGVYSATDTLNGHSDPQTVAYKAKVTLTAHLGTTHSKRTVGIYEQLPNGTERLLKTGAVNAAGNLATTVTMTQNQTFSAVFPGDAEDLSVTAYDVIHVRPVVTASISGYARTIKVAGVTYRVYHHTARLTAALAATPNKHGECFKLEAQSNAGSWDPNVTTACARSADVALLGPRASAVGNLTEVRELVHLGRGHLP